MYCTYSSFDLLTLRSVSSFNQSSRLRFEDCGSVLSVVSLTGEIGEVGARIGDVLGASNSNFSSKFEDFFGGFTTGSEN